jgi:uncharacterized protein (UPF0276 family)
MINLAINYSPQAAQLMAECRIEFDYFKCPDWPGMISEAQKLKPVAVHFTLIAGNGSLSSIDWNPIQALLEATSTPYINLHLGVETKNYPFIPADSMDPHVIQPLVDRMLQDVTAAVNRFGSERVIIENVPYRGSGGEFLCTCVEPGIFNQIVEETGCGLLLDISHARITAQAMNMDEKAYMQSLPVHRMKELHFTGVHDVDGRLQDHLPILPQDWLVFDWVLEKIQQGEWPSPWLVAYEYGGLGKWFEKRSDASVIAEQMPLLYERIKRLE